MQQNDPYWQDPTRPNHTNQPNQPPYSPGITPPAATPPPVVYRIERGRRRADRRRRGRPRRRFSLPRVNLGCLFILFLAGVFVLAATFYLLFPSRTNFMVMGIDYTDPGNAVARSDTNMLVTFNPMQPSIGILSIPRDLWVKIPGEGENRINTAHFFAESQQPGSGPHALLETVWINFGVRVPYYVRVRFEGFRELVAAMGGVDIELTQPMAGYDPGKYHLSDRKALEFVRHRQGSDDFYRMADSQFLVKSMFRNLLNPLKWPRLPAVAKAFFNTVDTNIPIWMWPRLGLALLRAGPNGIDNHIISRQMTKDFTTNEGAMVLLPQWELINPLVKEMFGQ